MNTTGFMDRRQHVRHHAGILPVLWPQGAAQLLDISSGGLGVHVAGGMHAVGDVVRFKVILSTGPFEGKGVVRWVAPLTQETCRCGIRYKGLSWFNRRRLTSFLCPSAFDLIAVLDQLLAAGALATATYCALLRLGITLPAWGEIQDLLYRLFT